MLRNKYTKLYHHPSCNDCVFNNKKECTRPTRLDCGCSDDNYIWILDKSTNDLLKGLFFALFIVLLFITVLIWLYVELTY